jgi:hypothetical protein
MKKAIVLMIGILLLGINLTAEAGDLIVEGNVGIGTPGAPTAPLDVNGSIKVKKASWEGIYFGDKPVLIWRGSGGGGPAITSNSLVVGTDDFVSSIYWDTIEDGFWAYCEGIVGVATGLNCADYIGTMTSNDHYWVWKNGHNTTPETKKDLKFLFDGQSNDGVMGYMEDEDAFYFNEKLGIGTNMPTAKLDVNTTTGYNQLRLRTQYTPTGTSDTNGSVGDIAWDDNRLYIKTTAGWKRTPQLETW